MAFTVPIREIARQWVAAVAMGGAVFIANGVVRNTSLLGGLIATLVLVVLGAATYFVVLAALSERFRATVRDNLPVT